MFVVAFFVGLAKAITRTVAFFGKEITEVIRRPGAVFSLVLGPFLIMALFGMGYSGQRRPLNAELVIPAQAAIPRDVEYYQDLAGSAVHILDVTEDVGGARNRLQRQEIDLVVVVPADLARRFSAGEQTVIKLEYNQTDPIRDAYIQLIANRQVQELNRVIIERLAAEGQAYAVATLQSPEPARIPPQVVAAPTRAESANMAPLKPSVTGYFAPAVLALVLQHMAITLTALSFVRERLGGVMDVFRVAPVRPLEIVAGKYLSFGFLNMVLAAAVTFLLVRFLGVPMLGGMREFATILLILTFASMGMGLLISTIADSERQAVQLSMLVLLASVFLSGFVLPLDEFREPVRSIGYLLPVTHGIRLLQDVMLRGSTNAVWQFWALLGFGVALFFATTLSLRRALARE